MNIGIIGTGNMGRALGLRWAATGHHVLFGSRDRAKAEAAADAAGGAGRARAGDFDAAVAFGEVVLYTVRGVFPSTLLREPDVLAGKIVIDCNNRDWGNDIEGYFRYDTPPPLPTLTEQLAADVPDARVVRAFSSIPARVIELPRETLAPHGVSVLLASDDAAAKAVVKGLAEELGFVGVDCGGIRRGRIVDGATDFLRYEITLGKLGMLATLSLKVLPNGSAT